jgi:hypothetical protein
MLDQSTRLSGLKNLTAVSLTFRPGSHDNHFLGRARCGDARHRTTLIHMCAGIRISLSSDIQRDGAAAEPEGFAVTYVIPTYGQHFFVDILCCIHIFLPTKNATTPRYSIVVHEFRGAAIL